MKLKNKKTGKIGKLHCDMNVSPAKYAVFEETGISGHYWEYYSLADLNDDWEDYEEPKEHWCITMYGGITRIKDDEELINYLIEIGNYFDSKEDAYDALDKIKAWKRLKDKGFRLNHWKEAQLRPNMSCVAITGNMKLDEEAKADLDLLFGGGE